MATAKYASGVISNRILTTNRYFEGNVKAHRTVLLQAKSGDARKVGSTVQRICGKMADWRFMVAQSKNYTAESGRPSYLIQFAGESGLPAAVVALTSSEASRRLRFHSPNIFPVKMGRISLAEYNALAVRFVTNFKEVPDYRGSGLSVSVTDEDLGLEQVVRGALCRKLFLDYLHGYPLTYHGADIARLDRFTCALHRSHAKTSPDDLARYLMEDKGWDQKDATWVRDRIRTGLEVLAENRRF